MSTVHEIYEVNIRLARVRSELITTRKLTDRLTAEFYARLAEIQPEQVRELIYSYNLKQAQEIYILYFKEGHIYPLNYKLGTGVIRKQR